MKPKIHSISTASAGLKSDRRKADSGSGFTLIELLVVIAIIGILAALIMAGLSAAKHRAWNINCTSNQRQVYLGMKMFTDDNDDYLPSGQEGISANYGLGAGQAAGYSTSYPSWNNASASGTWNYKCCYLTYALWSYVGMPAPSGATNIMTMMFCPANAQYNSKLATNALPIDQFQTYTMAMPGAGGIGQGLLIHPFGYHTTFLPHKMSEMSTASTTKSSPSDIWAMVDADYLGDPGAGSAGSEYPTTPAHGSVRNYMMFDGSVQSIKVQKNGQYY